MRQENTSGGEKQASGAGAKKGWRRIVSWAGPVAVGVAGLAAAAGAGYLQGEKIGAARAVAREVFTREHRELREVQAGIERAREVLRKIHDQERRAASELRATSAEPRATKAPTEVLPNEKGAAESQGAPASADHSAAPTYLPDAEGKR